MTLANSYSDEISSSPSSVPQSSWSISRPMKSFENTFPQVHQALEAIVYDVLVTEIRKHANSTLLEDPAEWSESNILSGGFPIPLYLKTEPQNLGAKTLRGLLGREELETGSIGGFCEDATLKMILKWFIDTGCARPKTPDNEDEAWCRAIFIWLYKFRSGSNLSTDIEVATQEMGRVRAEVAKEKVNIWIQCVSGPWILNGCEREQVQWEKEEPWDPKRRESGWMDHLKDVNFGEAANTPWAVGIGSSCVGNERASQLEESGMDALELWMDDEGWIWHTGGWTHAAYQGNRPCVCGSCQETEKRTKITKDERNKARERTNNDWNFGEDRIRRYEQAFCDLVHASISTDLRWHPEKCGKHPAMTIPALSQIPNLPQEHVEETLKRMLNPNRQLGEFHEQAREDQFWGTDLDCEIVRWLCESPREVSGMAWFHDMFDWMCFGKRTPWRKRTFQSVHKRLLAHRSLLKRAGITLWIAEANNIAEVSPEQVLRGECGGNRPGAGDSRVRPWESDCDGSDLWDPERLLRYQKLWAEASNGLHRLWPVRLNESVMTRRLVSTDNEEAYWNAPNDLIENHFNKIETGWTIEQRKWVKKSNSYIDIPKYWQHEDDENDNKDMGWIGDDGWIHHRKQCINGEGRVFYRPELHPAIFENGINSCEKCLRLWGYLESDAEVGGDKTMESFLKTLDCSWSGSADK